VHSQVDPAASRVPNRELRVRLPPRIERGEEGLCDCGLVPVPDVGPVVG
jgi:hypothetical protein